MLSWTTLAASLLLLTLAAPAFATDGVLEINQTCALQTGCFAGDAAGFPVTITAQGTSYRLTSALTVPNENTDAIVASTSNVSIDLNGFEVSGPVTCSGSPLVCTPASGTGSGVERTSSANRGISVKNGSITGMGNYGVYLADQAEVTGLRVRWNRNIGIYVGLGSIVSGNTASQNALAGISASGSSTVAGNTAYGNGTYGITVGTFSTVTGNTAYDNGVYGIYGNPGSTISGNTATSNEGDGIGAGAGSSVQRNTMRQNTGYGLNVGSQATYRENTVTSNTAGTVTGSGINMGDNSCNGTTTCP